MNSAANMKAQRTELSQLYDTALRNFLQRGPDSDMEPARELGRHAMKLGLQTLDMARIHEITLLSLDLPNDSSTAGNSPICRAGLFFAEAISPIEQTHRGAREANSHLNRIVETLGQRTLELAESVDGLNREILQRKAMEERLRTSEQTTGKLLEASRQMQDDLRHLSHQLLSAQEAERRKISRELHDVIAQTLTGINVRLAALKAESSASPTDLHRRITCTQRLVEKSVDIVHRFAWELRPTVLDDLGLIPALQSFMTDFIEDTGIRASLTVFAGIERANGNVRTMLYRVAQGALTNVALHAGASQVEVSIQESKGAIRMEITDNGKGFEVAANPCMVKHGHLGLLIMRERAKMVGGTFCVESSPGHPTTVRVELPPNQAELRKSPPEKSPEPPPKCP